jgi:hypothetical protein
MLTRDRVPMRLPSLLLLLLPVLAFAADEQPAAKAPTPFATGEKLSYAIRWGAIPAANAVFVVNSAAEQGDTRCHHMVMTVRTNNVLDAIYKVRDRVDAYVAVDMSGSLLYKKKQQEGRHNARDITVRFDPAAGTAQYTNHDRSRPAIEIAPGTFDPLSAFYAFRVRYEAGADSVAMPVTDGKRFADGSITVVGSDTVKTPAGTYKTMVAEVDMADVGGVFQKSNGAKLKVWFTDDQRRLPVRFSSKVAIGAFIGELVAAEGIAADDAPAAEDGAVEAEDAAVEAATDAETLAAEASRKRAGL